MELFFSVPSTICNPALFNFFFVCLHALTLALRADVSFIFFVP